MTFKEYLQEKGIGLNELYRKCGIKERSFYYFANGTYNSKRIKQRVAKVLGISIEKLDTLERKKNIKE